MQSTRRKEEGRDEDVSLFGCGSAAIGRRDRGTVSGNVFSYTDPDGGDEVPVIAGDMRGMTDGGKTLLPKKQ